MATASTGGKTWAGVVLPGLGHLLSGKLLHGIGLLVLTFELAWAAKGFPRLIDQLVRPGGIGFLVHPWVALCAWVAGVGGVWFTAFRHAKPVQISAEDARNDPWRVFWKQFGRNKTGVLGLYCVLFLLLLGALTPFLAPYDPDAIDVGAKLAGPSWDYPMGTDEFRRDVFSRVLYGARISLSIGFVAVSLTATIGTFLGALAGYVGGWLDKLIMWFTDLLLSLPRLVLLMAIVGLFRTAGAQSIFLIVVILGLTGWMSVCRIVRSQVLSLKEQDFVQATRALGLPPLRIILGHLVPNALAPVIVFASLSVGSMILVEASLSFLGLGVPPPTATWGSIVNDGREFLRSAWWITMFPGLMIVFAVMSFNLLGDGLRDALDPKLRGRG